MDLKDLKKKIEGLASEIVMTDPHDLQAVSRIMSALEEIAGADHGELEEVLKPLARAACDLAEDMIVQQGDEAAGSLETLSGAIEALQATAEKGPEAGMKLVPESLNVDFGGATDEKPADDSTSASGDAAASDDGILEEFLAAQDSVLEDMEAQVLAIEKEGYGDTCAAEIKRLFHTLKGESGFLGLGDISKVCHETETLIEKGANGELTSILLEVKDWLSAAFEAVSAGGAIGSADNILARLQGAPAEKAASDENDNEQESAPDTSGETILVSFDNEDPSLVQDFISESRSHLDTADEHLLTIEEDPGNAESLNAVFRSFHTIKGLAGFLGMKEIQSLAHAAEDLLDKMRKGALQPSGGVIDTVFESVDAFRVLVDKVEKALTSGENSFECHQLRPLLGRIENAAAGKAASKPVPPVDPQKKLGELLVESGKAKVDSINQTLQGIQEGGRLGEALVRSKQVAARDVAGALRAQNAARKPQAQQQQPARQVEAKEFIKIETGRLDKLLDAIGELVIAESMVSQDNEILEGGSPRVAQNLGHLHKISRVVQELGMSMRMVPVKPVFQKMARLVRDLSRKSGKDVEFVTNGEDTELDRSVVEKINDPLVHLVRNSMDHGIEENAEDRTAAGKPARSRLELRAFHQGGSIYIEIEDDGRGLDRDAILAKARERGLVQDGEELSDSEVFNLIFQPGFSTAKKVTDVSGRGVGMDVVRKNIESLRGTIELSSEPGKGTVVSMRLPLTLAIIDGMIVESGSENYIVPTLSMIESLRPTREMINTVYGRGEMLSLRGEMIPMFRLSRIFDIAGAVDEPTRAIAMIVEDQGRQVALLVDALIGQQQVVIKSIEEGLGKVPGISGGAIMPDGHVGLILDIHEIVRLASEQAEGDSGAMSAVARTSANDED